MSLKERIRNLFSKEIRELTGDVISKKLNKPKDTIRITLKRMENSQELFFTGRKDENGFKIYVINNIVREVFPRTDEYMAKLLGEDHDFDHTRVFLTAKILPTKIQVEYILVADNRILIDVWNFTARLAERTLKRGRSSHTFHPIPLSIEEEFNTLVDKVLTENGGALNRSGHYFPLTPATADGIWVILAKAKEREICRLCGLPKTACPECFAACLCGCLCNTIARTASEKAQVTKERKQAVRQKLKDMKETD